ncbi:MAG: right-handed parallel beta-helix repeat-containing protein [Verrucomicrobiota bacterium]|nr:right-handed parallel beta-helix repeat-containing protein [Verrucomicrobiota bacterium]
MKHALLLLLPISTLLARDIHVGKEAPTIHAAIKAAQPGDTIHLEPKVYRDYAGFYLKKGEPGKPITLDGHGATLEGSDPIDPAKWREISPGLFANDDLLPGLSDAAIGRWFFLFDGKLQLMGRTSKGRSASLKKPQELQAGEWTFVKDASREKPPSKAIYGTFYLKLGAGQTLAEAKVFAPMRSAGVQFGGDNAHLVIKNLTATHPYNDGFNIHGDCRDVVFENIRAIECGDDGISAHESAQYRVDGFISIGNSTGICDTGTAQTSYNRVFIADCIGFDLYFLDNGRYKLTNAVIFSKAQNPFTVTSREGQQCELEMDNVLFRRLVEPRKALIAKKALVQAKRLTMENITFDARGELRHEGAANVAELMKLVPKGYQP